MDYIQSWKTIWIKNFSLSCDVLDLSTEILKLTFLFGLKKSTFLNTVLATPPPKKVASILEFRSQQHINQVYNLISSFEAHLCTTMLCTVY